MLYIIISFLQNKPAALVKLQDTHWKPILQWARSTFGVEISTSDSFILSPHPPETVRVLDDVMSKFDHWQMAGRLAPLSTSGLRSYVAIFSDGTYDIHFKVVPDCTGLGHAANHG